MSWESSPCQSPYCWPIRSPGLIPRGWYLLVSSSSRAWTSLSTSPSRLTWRGCLSAVFAGVGMAYAYLTLSAEWHYFQGWVFANDPPKALQHMVEAGRLNPTSHIMRMAEAEYLIKVRWKDSGPLAMNAIRRAIQNNYYAIDLRRNLASFLWE